MQYMCVTTFTSTTWYLIVCMVHIKKWRRSKSGVPVCVNQLSESVSSYHAGHDLVQESDSPCQFMSTSLLDTSYVSSTQSSAIAYMLQTSTALAQGTLL